jgi:hypothetical protein
LSDLVLGAIIGVGATALGAIITGLINHKNIKLQLNYQKNEAQLNRLVEVRKELLLDLRRTISEWVECSTQQVNMAVRFQKALDGYKKESAERRLEIKKFFEVLDKMQQLSSQLNILRGQVSDSKLENLIEAVLDTQYKVDEQRMPLVRFFNNPGSADVKTFESALQTDEFLLKTVRDQILQVNKRIEELLSGEPSN